MTQPVLSPPRLSPQARLHRTARIGRALVLAGAALFLGNALGTWLFPDYAVHIIRSQTHAGIIGPLTTTTRVLYVLWDIPSLAVILMALRRLWQLFGEYLQSRVFSARALKMRDCKYSPNRCHNCTSAARITASDGMSHST